MASALCRSKSLTNVYVQKVAVLDIMELKTADDQVRSNQWAYVISVTWSDTRESKVAAFFSEMQGLSIKPSGHCERALISHAIIPLDSVLLKIYREYSEITILYNTAYKLRYSDKSSKNKNLAQLPKVPSRGFFNWSLIKLMIKNQSKVDHFLKVLITLPGQISREKRVLDFFELKLSDSFYHPRRLTTPHALHATENNHCKNIASTINNNRADCDAISAQSSSNDDDSASVMRPSYLPVTSCFEPDDVFDDAENSYQTLLEDITSFDLYEDYDILYNVPLKNLFDLQNKLHNNSRGSRFYEQDWWLKECEDILSPYSPNKAYFRLVQELDIY